MSLLADLKMYWRFAVSLRRFLCRSVTVEEASAVVRERMQRRGDNFLRQAERSVFGYPRSPYLPLFRVAGIGMDDLRAWTRADGLEGTLRRLREAGVYFSFEEFKGRRPALRRGREIRIRPADFDNPFLSPAYEGTTSGSTGAGTRVALDLDHLAAIACNVLLVHEAHGTKRMPSAVWFGMPPDLSSLYAILLAARIGQTPRAWFSTPTGSGARPSMKFRLIGRSFPVLARLCGTQVPDPVPLDLEQAGVLADWAVEQLKTTGNCRITTHVSKVLRICLAAAERGLDLSGTVFYCSGEPPTPAKVRGITATGARVVPTYFFMETGAVGYGCANPADENDIHFFKDMLALIRYPATGPGDAGVESFHFTTLLPAAPKILLNVESDDCGVVEQRSCGCLLESCGFTEHLRDIRSYRKLVGEGVTLIGTEMVRILEDVLPSRFGGSPFDYQLHEEEDERGFTRLTLLVSPSVGAMDELQVARAVLDSLGRSSGSARMAADAWQQARTLRVKRADPVWNPRGKFMSIIRTGALGPASKRPQSGT
ncbi:MAG: hypothetical protein FJW35_01955 [Acidobacteria bacterium]|nr:hypothetical protein [Acidobacteriota bacterium]